MRDVALHKSEVGVVCYFIEVRADEAGSAGEEDFHNILSAKSREFAAVAMLPRKVAPRMLFCAGISVHKILLGAGIHEGGTTEVVLSGLHVKVQASARRRRS